MFCFDDSVKQYINKKITYVRADAILPLAEKYYVRNRQSHYPMKVLFLGDILTHKIYHANNLITRIHSKKQL